MRSFAVLALCLGLFAVAQALDQTEGVLLKGLTPDEDLYNVNGNVSVLNGHHHWHRHHHHHDPEDHEYWHRRHSAKSELLHCLKLAHDDCDIDDVASLRRAGRRIARCLLEHLGGCHDIPGLGGDITKSIPFIMMVQGFEALIEAKPTGLAHAQLVFEFYLAGATPAFPPNIYNLPGGCASQLYSLITTGTQGSTIKQIHALAEVVANFIKKLMDNQNDPNFGLGACAPDVPAVLVSLFTTGCPPNGKLVNPLTQEIKECTYVEANTYEKSAAALLGGSVYSLLLLSSEPKVKALGVQVAFAALRFALAATQTTGFQECLDNNFPPAVDANGPFAGLYTGELHTALQLVPILSGKFGTFTAATPSQLGPDGTRVVCASIGMMSFARGWQRNLMWQGAADIVNALYSTIETTGLLTKDQRKELCVSTRAVYTFIKTNPQNNPLNPVGPAVIAAPAIPPISPPPGINTLTEFDWSCSTTQVSQAGCTVGQPTWLDAFYAPFKKPELVAGHDFTAGPSGSPFVRVCAAAFP